MRWSTPPLSRRTGPGVAALDGTVLAKARGRSDFVQTMMLRNTHPDASSGHTRLNLLLSDSGWRSRSTVDQIPSLLEPMGIQSIRVTSGQQAAQVIRSQTVHIAVVDMGLPLAEDEPGLQPGGERTLQLLRRLAEPPPTVVVRAPQPAARQDARGLRTALREGAFAVLDRPVAIETLLEVMRRILHRHYSNVWPDSPVRGSDLS